MKCIKFILAGLILLMAAEIPLFGVSYKVETFKGVPFVTVDGKPVRSRHFLGWFAAALRPQYRGNGKIIPSISRMWRIRRRAA